MTDRGQYQASLRFESTWGRERVRRTGSASVEFYRAYEQRWVRPRVQRRATPASGASVNAVIAGIGVSLFVWNLTGTGA